MSPSSSITGVRRALISVSDKNGVADFARQLSRHGVEIVSTGGTKGEIAKTGVPVVDVSGALIGVVTEYDIISKQGDTVGEIMSRGVVTVTAETTAQRVIDLVGLHGIRGIPVLADGKLVGLVTRADLVKLFLRQA